jgi:hypothetical protein
MIYVDYNFDLSDGAIILDSELKLKDQKNENDWGNLPDGWKVGDVFRIVELHTGAVALIKQVDDLK